MRGTTPLVVTTNTTILDTLKKFVHWGIFVNMAKDTVALVVRTATQPGCRPICVRGNAPVVIFVDLRPWKLWKLGQTQSMFWPEMLTWNL
jgi:hypothetical protein